VAELHRGERVNAWWARLPRNSKITVGVGGLAAVFVAYRWWAGRKAAAAAAAAQSSSGSNTTTGGIDPTTGQPYASELASEEQSAQTAPEADVTLPNGSSYSGPAYGLSTALNTLQPPATTAANTAPTPSAVEDLSGKWWIPIPNPSAAAGYQAEHIPIGYFPNQPPAGGQGSIVITGWPPKGVTGSHTFFAAATQ
jgi:hypothetical protein